MVAQYWSSNISLTELREKFRISITGLTLADLVSYSEQIGFTARAIKIEVDDGDSFRVPQHPIILHWEMNHFVVLKKKTRKGYLLHDPAIGEIFVSRNDFLKKFTGIALDLRPKIDFATNNKKKKSLISNFLKNVDFKNSKFYYIITISIIVELLFYSIPFFGKNLMSLAESGATINLEDMFLISILLFSLLTLAYSLTEIRNKILTNFAARFGYSGSVNIMSKLMRLPINYFEARFVGDIATKVNTIETIRNMINPATVVTLIEGVSAIILFLVMLSFDVSLAFIGLLPLFIFTLYRHLTMNTMATLKNERTLAYSKMNGQLYQNIRAISSIKLNSLSSIRSSIWNSIVYKSEILLSRSNIYIYRNSNIISIFEKLDLGIVIIVGSFFVSKARIDILDLAVIITIRMLSTRRLLSLVNLIYDLKLLEVYIQRVKDITETQDEQGSMKLNKFLEPYSSLDLVMKDVSFQYSTNLPFAVKNLDLKVNAGEIVAITAHSGAGKSTVLKLICGLVEPQQGTIMSNGQEINDENIISFRSHLGVVMQDDQVFSGTLLENIISFGIDVDEQRLNKALEIACLTDFVDSLPMRLNTLITDLGGSLSGGQKQRLMLARAIYRNPKMLLLDEATSHLDLLNEREIMHNLRMLGITIIHVAHRQQTLELADRVINLQ